MRICFDMDGTIADLYGVDNWLAMLIQHDATPYKEATALVNMNQLARTLNKLQKAGHEVGIISWLAKGSTTDYDEEVRQAKIAWLKKHLKSVHFDFIEIVPHGTDKNIVCVDSTDILFDDEERNRENWNGKAYDVDKIFTILQKIQKSIQQKHKIINVFINHKNIYDFF